MAMLISGRGLFWLFVAVLGFFVGFDLTALHLTAQPQWLAFAVSAALGVLCAFAAVFVQRAAFAVAGFLGGGYIFVFLAALFGWDGARSAAAFFIAGILGGVATFFFADAILIILSSLVGAAMIVDATTLRPASGSLVFVAASAFGILFQSKFFSSPKPLKQSRPHPEANRGRRKTSLKKR